MYRKSIYTKERATVLCGNRIIMGNTKDLQGMYGFTGKNRTIWGRAVARPVCQDLPNFCRLRYPFRCSAYYITLNSFSLLESIWLR